MRACMFRKEVLSRYASGKNIIRASCAAPKRCAKFVSIYTDRITVHQTIFEENYFIAYLQIVPKTQFFKTLKQPNLKMSVLACGVGVYMMNRDAN